MKQQVVCLYSLTERWLHSWLSRSSHLFLRHPGWHFHWLGGDHLEVSTRHLTAWYTGSWECRRQAAMYSQRLLCVLTGYELSKRKETSYEWQNIHIGDILVPKVAFHKTLPLGDFIFQFNQMDKPNGLFKTHLNPN